MRTPTAPQSYFRYPLSRIFASEGAVRVLRELARYGGELSVPALAAATRLNKETVRPLLRGDLSIAGVVETVGTGRFTLYRLRTDHALHGPLTKLFEEEEARVRRVFQALASAASAVAPGVLAVWVYGSVARGEDAAGSDLDVAIVLSDADLDPVVDRYREAIGPLLAGEGVKVSVVGLSATDIVRVEAADDPWWRSVAADAMPVLGPPPVVIAERLRSSPSDEARQVA